MPTNYTPSQVYDKYVALQKQLATNITNKGVTASQTELYDNLIDKVAQIENLKGEERTLENFTDVLSETKSIVQLEYPEPKNLFDETAIVNTTVIGLTMSTNSDGSHKLTGTLTGSFFNYFNKVNLSQTIPKGTTVTVSGWYDTTPTGNYIGLVGYDKDNKILFQANEKASGEHLTTTLTADLVSVGLVVRCVASAIGDTVTFDNIKLQLELGSTATPYEPYPAPKTLNAKLGTVNLFTPNTTPTVPSNMGVTCTYDSTDNTFTINGTLANEGNINLATLNIPLDDYYIVRYYVSGDITVPESVTYKSLFSMFVYGSSSRYLDRLSQTVANYNTPQIAIEAKNRYSVESADKWTFYMQNFGVGTVFDNYKFKIAIIKKNIYYTGIPFTPYISDFSTVDVTRCGKNLFDEKQITGCKLKNGTISKTYGEVTNEYLKSKYATYGDTTYWIDFQIYLKANVDYTISTDAYYATSPNNVKAVSIGVIDQDYNITHKLVALSANDIWERVAVTISVSQEGLYWLTAQPLGNATQYSGLDCRFKNIQIELCSTATEYEPYQGQTYTPTATGEVIGITNLYPTTTLLTNNAGVVFEQVTGQTYKEILPSTDKNGITKVYQPSVDSTIDSNIKPENIKKDVSILGVTGDYICNYTYDETTKELVLIL